jgi:DNA excision repair protein ERCC-4
MVPVVTGTLETGDYSLVGHESKIAIERKSLADLYSTIGQNRERFEREFERLNEMRHPYLLIEADWPVILDPPDNITAFTKLPPKTISRTAISWSQKYPRVQWWPCGTREIAEAMTFRILERYMRDHV